MSSVLPGTDRLPARVRQTIFSDAGVDPTRKVRGIWMKNQSSPPTYSLTDADTSPHLQPWLYLFIPQRMALDAQEQEL